MMLKFLDPMRQLSMMLSTLKQHTLPISLLGVAVAVLVAGFMVLHHPAQDTEARPSSFYGQTFATCLETTDIPEKVSCWTGFIEEKMHTVGLQDTFDIFTEIYRADPDFVAHGCHGAVHSIGEIAFDLYASGTPLQFSDETAACGYGFYHGFLGKLLHADPDMQGAVRFCESLRNSMTEDGEGAYITCFHGIGHGMVEEEPLHEYYWGNFEALLDPALATCSTLPEPFQQRECVDGAFNGLNIFMSNDRYGFTYDTSDPFGWCDRFKENRMYFVSCHFEMSQSFVAKGIITDDAAQVLPYIEGLDTELQRIVVEIAVGNMLQSGIIQDDHSDYFRQCGNFPSEELAYACLNGIVGGLFAYGEPGNELEKAQAFCDSSNATMLQREQCEQLIISYSN